MAPPPTDAFPRDVLIVDDEKTVTDVLMVVLRKHGIASRSAASAEEAIALLQTQRFGCVLTDKNLPEGSGLDVIKEARRLHPWCACLMMTGYPNAESLLAAMRLGAIDYLEKPFTDLKLVVQKVENAMEHARTAFERSALAAALHELQATLKQTEAQSFKQQTELDVFTEVLELRVEDATRSLQETCSQQQATIDQLREQLAALEGRMSTVGADIQLLATRAGASLGDARGQLKQLAEALDKAAAALRG